MTDKKKLRTAAEVYFINHHLTQKEIAAKLGVTEKTIGDWAKAGKWKEKRVANENSTRQRSEDIKAVISELTQRRLEVFKEEQKAIAAQDKAAIIALKKEAVNIGMEVAMFNKALQKMEAENKITLSVYIEVMESIFKSMQSHNSELFIASLDFQEMHLTEIADKLG